jgi:hypothetical protein
MLNFESTFYGPLSPTIGQNIGDEMSDRPLYEFDTEARELLIKRHLKGSLRADFVRKFPGAFGDVYLFDKGQTFPRYIAAKCPQFERFGTAEEAHNALQSFLHEVDATDRVYSSPWVNRFFDVQLIHGWP